MIYTYRCKACGALTDARRTVNDRHNAPECQSCGGETYQIMTPVRFNSPMGGADNPGYLCPVTEKFVTSRRERRNIMAEHDLVEAPKSVTV